METMKRRLGRAVCAPAQGGRPTHAWGERAAVFTFQVDTEAVGVLGMLQQEPGAAVRLLTRSAGIGGRLLFTCCDREERSGLEKSIQHLQHHPHFVTARISRYESIKLQRRNYFKQVFIKEKSKIFKCCSSVRVETFTQSYINSAVYRMKSLKDNSFQLG